MKTTGISIVIAMFALVAKGSSSQQEEYECSFSRMLFNKDGSQLFEEKKAAILPLKRNASLRTIMDGYVFSVHVCNSDVLDEIDFAIANQDTKLRTISSTDPSQEKFGLSHDVARSGGKYLTLGIYCSKNH